VIDVSGKPSIRFGVIERLGQEDLVDGLRRRFDAARAGQVLTEGLADEVPERRLSRAGDLGCTAVQVTGQQKLSAVHV
jgi:hypothetical protein